MRGSSGTVEKKPDTSEIYSNSGRRGAVREYPGIRIVRTTH